jgi:hypothetical protein
VLLVVEEQNIYSRQQMAGKEAYPAQVIAGGLVVI